MAQGFSGLLVLDKPTGMTSRAAVDRALKWFPRGTRIGHAGTLDPLATGVLVLCVGAATRLTEYVQAMPKVYRAGITLGATSDTDDADGTITTHANVTAPTRETIEISLGAFLGVIEQIPPAYSAAKVAGRRAYALARKGYDVDLQPRKVRIDRIEILAYEYPRLELLVHCGKGTYIRSLARDLGLWLGCGGHIHALRRLAIGSFTEADALSLQVDAEMARSRLLPAWRAIQDSPPVRVTDADAARLRNGGAILALVAVGMEEFAVADSAGDLVAIVEAIDDRWQPRKVMPGC